MRILVTGGAGFIGSHLVDKLMGEGHKVTVIDDLSGGDRDNTSQDVHVVDCRDELGVDSVFSVFKPEIVYHLAANAAESKAQFSPVDITSRNYDAFIKVLTSFIRHGGKRFIFTSSIAVYGSGQTPFKEDDKPEPEDLYGITKLAAEQTLKVMSKVHDFEYVIARPHNVYGPRQNMSDPYRNVVTIWMNAFLKRKPYYIYGDGTMKRCFSYVDDVVDALYKCSFETVTKRIFNIGSDTSYTLNELSKIMEDEITAFGRIPYKPKYLPRREQEVQEVVADHALSQKYLNYIDRTNLVEGIAKTWDWCKKQGPQELKYTKLELESDKIPKNWI